MLLAIEFPDRAGDALTSKRTLIVRLGAWRGARLYAAVTGLAFAALPLLALLGLPGRMAVAAAVPAPSRSGASAALCTATGGGLAAGRR
jgi:1,4-dihydroxy-2-naphthoate octaprenyltransferase